MLKRLSQVYASRRNKRMGGRKGLRPPSVKNFYESVFITYYNRLMETIPENAITMEDGTYITTNAYEYVLI